jgi:hypothetical protein
LSSGCSPGLALLLEVIGKLHLPVMDEQTSRHVIVMSAIPESGHLQCTSGCPLWANSGR